MMKNQFTLFYSVLIFGYIAVASATAAVGTHHPIHFQADRELISKFHDAFDQALIAVGENCEQNQCILF